MILTAYGSIGNALKNKYGIEVVSFFELGKDKFEQKILNSDYILHNAASINCSSLSYCVERNFTFTKYLIDLIGDKNLIFFSSMSTLASLEDMSFYGYSKFIAETYCLKSNKKIVRFSTIFYQDKNKDGLSYLVYEAVRNKSITIYNGGISKRNFISLDSLCKVVYEFIPNSQEKVVNLTGETYSFNDVVKILTKLVPNLKVSNKEVKEKEVLYGPSSYVTKFDLEAEIYEYKLKLERSG
jgi:nucleoside-diphosphate-sugar epimerase